MQTVAGVADLQLEQQMDVPQFQIEGQWTEFAEPEERLAPAAVV